MATGMRWRPFNNDQASLSSLVQAHLLKSSHIVVALLKHTLCPPYISLGCSCFVSGISNGCLICCSCCVHLCLELVLLPLEISDDFSASSLPMASPSGPFLHVDMQKGWMC